MKKGFTLVEILGVIVILALVAAIVVPVATSVITRNTDKLNNVQLDSIRNGAIEMTADAIIDSDLLNKNIPDENNGCIYVTLEDLIKKGYVAYNIVDINTTSAYNGVTVYISYLNNRLVYDIYEGSQLIQQDNNRTGSASEMTPVCEEATLGE